MARTKLTPKQLAGLASDLLLNFGNGTPVQALDSGRDHSSSQGYFKIGSVLVQWASTTATLTAVNTSVSWGVTWPLTFNTADAVVVSPNGSYSTNNVGGVEAFSTSTASGFFLGNGGVFPRTVTIYAIAVGK